MAESVADVLKRLADGLAKTAAALFTLAEMVKTDYSASFRWSHGNKDKGKEK